MTKKLLKKISTSMATGALVLGLVTPAFASTQVTVGSNGAFSNNTANVTNTNVSSTTQTNNTYVSNTITTTSNTGGNNSSFNTGGNSGITTGQATSHVNVINLSGVNINANNSCGCQGGDTSAKIKGNGAFSKNTIGVTNT